MQLEDSNLDFMEKFRKMIEYISKENPKESVHFMHDVKNNAPNVWSELIEMRNRDIPVRMGFFLKDGIKRGIIKKNINTDLFIRIHLSIVKEILNPETLLELNYSIADLIQEIDMILFFGIMDQDSKEFQNSKYKKYFRAKK